MNKICKLVIIVCTILGVLIILFLGFLSAKYDYDTHGDWVTALSGFWSAFATVILGAIALSQNVRYKKLADETNRRLEDIIMRPECYLMYVNSCKFDSESKIYCIPTQISNGYYFTFDFYCLNLPIFSFGLDSINMKDEKGSIIYNFVFNNAKREEFMEKGNGLRIKACVPYDLFTQNIVCNALFSYNNMHGMRYKQNIELGFSKGILGEFQPVIIKRCLSERVIN